MSPGGSTFSSSGGARRLLSRLRDVMAGSGEAQARLNKIVQLIATEMGADVCSVYVMRAGEVLELFATHGLNQDAVHVTRMSVNEGLVGLVASSVAPVKLANARNHPRFAYRPETGEDPFQSLAGAPILRGGRVRGVLVIQNKDRRDYHDDEVETLQTIAMIVAEMIAQGEMVGRSELATLGDADLALTRINGTTLNDGIGIGLAVLHRPQITVSEMVADDPEREMQRLGEAMTKMHSALDELEALTAASGDAEHLDILETYRMLAQDRGWLRRINEAIQDGLSAEAAIQKVQNDTRARMAQMTDSYIRERLLDLEDVTNRLLYHLQGKRSEAASGTLPDDIILVARNMGPAELLDYDRGKLRGLLLEEGSQTAHVAIIARTLGIPVVGRCQNVMTRIDPLDPLILDGDHGQVYLRPAEDIENAYRQALTYRAEQRQQFAALRDVPSISDDGYRISLNLNAGMLIDMAALDETRADGVGLYRTEIPFMVRSDFPSVAAQTELYGKMFEQAAGRPVTVRTLDVGGDKKLAYLPEDVAENPAMGWRAIRMGLDRPAMLCQQLRALLAAAGDHQAELRIMFPMISDAGEFRKARLLLDREIARRQHRGLALPSAIKAGMMLEVPAVLWQLPQMLRSDKNPKGVEFVSIGTNDLMQFLFANDRGDPRLHGRYDTLAPALLMVLRQVQQQCRAAGVPVTICGEMAARPLDAMALLGLGYRALSMSAPAVARVKQMVCALKISPFATFLNHLLDQPREPSSLRGYMADYARDHNIPV